VFRQKLGIVAREAIERDVEEDHPWVKACQVVDDPRVICVAERSDGMRVDRDERHALIRRRRGEQLVLGCKEWSARNPERAQHRDEQPCDQTG